MRKILLFLLGTLLISANLFAQPDLRGKKIYVNPGHGSWGADDRPYSTIPYPFKYKYTDSELGTGWIPDTLGFFESNTNLWKCLYLGEKLKKYGATVSYSHTKAGPSPYPYISGSVFDWAAYKKDKNFGTYNRDLYYLSKDIGNNYSDYDYFISVHSNSPGASGDQKANYPMFLYRGYNGGESNPKNASSATRCPYNKNSYEMAEIAWKHAYELIEGISSLRHPYSGETPSVDDMLIYGDRDFYTWDEKIKGDTVAHVFNGIRYPSYLGAIRHMVPGFLVEGYHHSYGPARHRALNPDYCKMEGLAYFRGILDYFGVEGEKVGYILGVIKDNNTLAPDHKDYRYHAGSHDQWMPCNGAVVVLKQAGKEKKRYTVDNNYNGIFAFFDLTPGVYTLESTVGELKFSEQVVVKANETTYSKLYPHAVPAICAYGLKVKEGVDAYSFSFYANTAATAAKILFYDELKQYVGERTITVNKGENEISIPKNEMPGSLGQTLSWELDLTGEKIENFALQYANSTLNIISGTQIFNAVNTNPLSDKFGYMYAMCRAANSGDNRIYNGIWEFNYEYDKLNKDLYRGGQTFGHPTRISIDSEGYLYMSDWSDNHSGVFVANTEDLSKDFTQFFAGTRANDGKFTNAGVATGSSTPGCYIYEDGNFTKLYVYDEDVASNGVLVYNIKEGDGATIRQWTKAPSKKYADFTGHNSSGNANVWATSKGFFVAQTTATATNTAAMTALQFYNNAGTCKFNSSVAPWLTTINACEGAGLAVSKDEKTLILNNGSKQFLVFDITWNGETPTLKLVHTYTHNLEAIRQMNWDYAGNLICSGDDGIHIFSVPEESNNTVIPAKQTFVLKAERPVVTQRIAAYDLRVTENADTYTFSFYANDAATEAKIVFFDAADPTSVIGEKSISVAKGNNQVTIPAKELPGVKNQQLSWALDLQGGYVKDFKLLHSDASLIKHSSSQLFCAVDNNPMSEKFGHIYIMHRGGRKSVQAETTAAKDNGLWEYDYTFTKQNAQVYKGGEPFGHPTRMTIDSEGYLYISDWSDGQSGVYVANTADLTQKFTQFFAGTRAKNGTFTNSGNATGSSTPGCYIYEDGNSTKLYVYDEDVASNGVLVYNIKEGDGATTRQWTTVPSHQYLDLTGHNTSGQANLWVTSHGFFVSQTTVNPKNSADVPSLQFYNNAGTCKFNSSDAAWLTKINACDGGGFAVSKDEKTLILNNGSKQFLVFDIKWNKGIPTISLVQTYTHNLKAIRQMSMDYAGNLICAGDAGVHIFSVPTTENRVLVPAKATVVSQAAGPASQRIWAYDLKKEETSDGYVFSFKTLEEASAASLILKYGEQTTTIPLNNVVAGYNEFLIEYGQMPQANTDIYWEVQLTAGKVEEQTTLHELTSNIDKFYHYLPQDVKVNNNPASDHFGKVYVLEPIAGSNDGLSAHSKTQTAGIYVYDPELNMANYAKGYLPIGVTVDFEVPSGCNYRKLHRIAINPVTSEVAFVQSKTNQLWIANPDDLNATAVNVLAGKTKTNASSLCYDATGQLFIFGYKSTDATTEAVIYKLTPNNTLVEFAKISAWAYANERNSMSSDGHGGLWVTSFEADGKPGYLLHINQSGSVDLKIQSNGTTLTAPISPQQGDGVLSGMPLQFNRGQLAYDTQRDILAVGGTKAVQLFRVSYNQNGAPSLRYWISTPTLGNNIDGVAFDYAGDLYVLSASVERFYKFAVPTETNTCITPAPDSQRIKTMPILLDDTKDNTERLSEAIAAGNPRNVTVQYTNAMSSGIYTPICLPFDVTDLDKTSLAGAKVLAFNGVQEVEADGQVDIFLIFDTTDKMQAGVPYLVSPEVDMVGALEFPAIHVFTTTASAVTCSNITFQGVLSPLTLNTPQNTLLLDSKGQVTWANAKENLHGMSAYFSVAGAVDKSSAKFYISEQEIGGTSLPENHQVVLPSKFIKNGVLYIIRNNEIYTILGAKVAQ